MAIYISALIGSVVWVVLWALAFKSFDAFMLMLLIVLVGCVIHIVTPHLPGNKPDSIGTPPPGS